MIFIRSAILDLKFRLFSQILVWGLYFTERKCYVAKNRTYDSSVKRVLKGELFLTGLFFPETENFLMGIGSLFVVLVAVVGIRYVTNQNNNKQHIKDSVNNEPKHVNSESTVDILTDFGNIHSRKFKLSSHAKKKILRELNILINEKKVYRQKGITLEKLARMQGTNRTYLSSVIRDEYGENFTCFINRHRIEEATKLLADPHNKEPIKAIAENLGYQSLSTFYTAFNKNVNSSPSYYRKNSQALSINRVSKGKKSKQKSHC